ncbi:hypothetical protein [Endozoicomonas sp. ONNA2]|uniref:hypothetical protein n=1 Tax=Endozoicomonas sp. ONNA2 TaxID=2828741 RepID=UPI002149359C|nr:hypothetical protein [Endozoicomonas sp. ONNA2]
MLRRVRTSAQIMITVFSFMGCYQSGNVSESVLAAQYRCMSNRYETRKDDREAGRCSGN